MKSPGSCDTEEAMDRPMTIFLTKTFKTYDTTSVYQRNSDQP